MEFLQLSGPLLDIFLFFSKTKIFHSHPCVPWFKFVLQCCDWHELCVYQNEGKAAAAAQQQAQDNGADDDDDEEEEDDDEEDEDDDDE